MSFRYPLSQREQKLAIICAGCLVFLFMIQYPSGWRKMFSMDKSEQIIRSEQKLIVAQRAARKSRAMAEQVKKAAEVYGPKMSEQEWSAQTMVMVQGSAKAHAVMIQELNALPIERSGGIHTEKAQVTVLGTWASIMRFFNALQGADGRFNLDEWSLERSVGNEGFLRCQMIVSRWSFVLQAE